MAFSFPSSPTLNQTYTYNSITWTYNGKGWNKASSGGGGASVTSSATAPASPTAGAMWLDSENGDLYVYGGGNWILTGFLGSSFSGNYNDLTNKPTITSVVPSAISDQANSSTGYFSLPAGTTAQRPATAYTGATRLNTTTNYLEIYNGSNWVNLQYVGLLAATYTGATVAYSGNYAILTYTSTGTFNVSSAPVGATIDYLIVAGGGGGGTMYGGGGGGGGYLTATGVNVTATNYAITVGSGGASLTQGGNSSIAGTGFTTATAVGGGAGGNFETAGSNGGSGGGGGGTGSGNSKAVGTGTAGPPRQGYDGGLPYGQNAVGPAGGGGGAGGVGGAAAANIGGAGGIGYTDAITGLVYAGGGGGGSISGTGGAAGTGGGGAGSASTTGGAGTANRGGGGGGGGGNSGAGGAGGSGVVIIKYRYQ